MNGLHRARWASSKGLLMFLCSLTCLGNLARAEPREASAPVWLVAFWWCDGRAQGGTSASGLHQRSMPKEGSMYVCPLLVSWFALMYFELLQISFSKFLSFEGIRYDR